jgi:hypothetical protein
MGEIGEYMESINRAMYDCTIEIHNDIGAAIIAQDNYEGTLYIPRVHL